MHFKDWHTLPAAVAPCILVTAWLFLILKRAYLTPLRTIPGPWYARFTNLWLKQQVLRGRRMHYIHQLHEKYGMIVRISPDEVDVSDPAAFKEIHRIGSGYLKSPWYQASRPGDTQDVFSMINPKAHAARRKLFSPLFSKSALRINWHDVVVEKVTMTVQKIKMEAITTGEADIFKWWTFMATDVVSHIAFGEPFRMLELEKRPEPMQKIEDAGKLGPIASELPWLFYALRWIPLNSIQSLLNAGEKVHQFAEDTMRRVKENPLGAANIFSKIVYENEKNSAVLTDYMLAFEAAGFIVAGSGTTAVTLTYLIWAVLSNPEIQARLEREVSDLPLNHTDSDLERLPYLSAVVDETLRLYGAAPGSLPRSVPPGGATLLGHFIPGGTTVCTQAYTLHRNGTEYPEPNSFVPERFISATGEYQTPQKTFAPFGTGARTCLGVHLARMELRHGVAQFFRECRGARLSPSTTAESMDMVNYFLISPAAQKCCILLDQC